MRSDFVFALGRHCDMAARALTPSHYFVARDSGRLEVSALTGGIEVLSVGTTNISHYPQFVEDVLRRVQAGEAPVAGLREAAEAMSILGDVYQLASPGDRGGSHAVG